MRRSGEIHGAIFGPVIARRLMKDFSAARSALQSVPSLPELTNREREVLALIAEYRTNTEIAWRLGLSGSDPLAANLR